MTDITELEKKIHRLEDIDAIKQLKAKYFRCLDSKLWDELAECFTEDVTTDYTDGLYRFEGKDAVMNFLKGGLGRPTFFGFHQGHHPEIEITGKTTARGVWSSHYYMIDTEASKTMQCGAFYRDEFVKQNGQWKIKATGYTSIFEENWDREGPRDQNLVKKMKFPENSFV